MTAVAVTLVASIAATAVVVAVITIANWPRETPRRRLGDTMELAPFERL
jgi:hypothetical protein